MNPFSPEWRSGITVPPSRKRKYRYRGLVKPERQPNAFTIIPRAKARQDSDRRDALKRTIHTKEQA